MKVVVVLSGGIDSTTLLWKMVKEGHDVHAFTVNYGQLHKREIDSALYQTRMAKVPHEILVIPTLRQIFKGSALTDLGVSVPEGRYEEENMKKTVVPNRNMILISLAVAYAISIKADAVAYAAHSGDHTIYPDCRPEFVAAMASAVSQCDWNPPSLMAPFLHMRKSDIVKLGQALGVDFSHTWSCYKGGILHCGRCGTCIERREAFLAAGVPDPTQYQKSAPPLTTS